MSSELWYVTRYALTEGIIEAPCEASFAPPGYLNSAAEVGRKDLTFLRPWKDIFPTLEAAKADVLVREKALDRVKEAEAGMFVVRVWDPS